MQRETHEPSMLFSGWMWVLSILILLLLALAVWYGAQHLTPLSPSSQRPIPGATTQPPTGRRWFWQRGQWQGPQFPQP